MCIIIHVALSRWFVAITVTTTSWMAPHFEMERTNGLTAFYDIFQLGRQLRFFCYRIPPLGRWHMTCCVSTVQRMGSLAIPTHLTWMAISSIRVCLLNCLWFILFSGHAIRFFSSSAQLFPAQLSHFGYVVHVPPLQTTLRLSCVLCAIRWDGNKSNSHLPAVRSFVEQFPGNKSLANVRIIHWTILFTRKSTTH